MNLDKKHRQFNGERIFFLTNAAETTGHQCAKTKSEERPYTFQKITQNGP